MMQTTLLKGLFGVHFMASQSSRWAKMTELAAVTHTGYKMKLSKHGGAGQ